MPALVSVLIPCFNAARWLAETLESVRAQTWPHVEIILVDDGSTDQSLAVARRYENETLKILSQPHLGASAARNAALAIAQGDFVQFLDADDLLAPDKIALQIVTLLESGTDHALSGMWTRFHRSIADADFTPQPLCADLPAVDWLVLKLEQNRMMHPGAWLLSRSIVDRVGPWDESLSLNDDGEYFTRAVLTSAGVRCCGDAVSYYRSGRRGSLSRMQSESAWISAWRSLELSANRLLETENSPRVRRACATAFQRYEYEAYPRARGCRRRALSRVAELGGSTLQPEGGPLFHRASQYLGWKLTKRLQNARAAIGRVLPS